MLLCCLPALQNATFSIHQPIWGFCINVYVSILPSGTDLELEGCKRTLLGTVYTLGGCIKELSWIRREIVAVKGLGKYRKT